MIHYTNPSFDNLTLSDGKYLFLFLEHHHDIAIHVGENAHVNVVAIFCNSSFHLSFTQRHSSNLILNSISCGEKNQIIFDSMIGSSDAHSESHHYLFSQSNSIISFDGSVRLGKGIIGSSGYLYEHNLILGENISVSTKPNLDVHSNDIKAGHGATIQKMDLKQLFYPMSRGLSNEQAKKLLIEGIISTSISILGEEPELHHFIYTLSDLISGQTQTPTNRSQLQSALGVSQSNSEND